VFAVAVGLLALAHPGPATPRAGEAAVAAGVDQPTGGGGELTLFLAGDTIITQPWSGDREPGFLALVDEVRAADVAIVNLETLFHDYGGYAQADSGGTYMTSRPELAAELAWAGVDMLANANNHTFDYGTDGVLENLDNAAKAGLVVAGAGRDLQGARAPAYFEHPRGGTVALVSATASFTPYGKASASRPDMRGRPGVNPLTVEFVVELPGLLDRAVRGAGGLLGLNSRSVPGGGWRFDALDVAFRSGGAFGVGRGHRIAPADLEANLAAVREAAARADVVVFSLHAHSQAGFSREEWLGALARQVIDAGADVFFAHGPHEIRGVELYKNRPILYGLGNFVFQYEQVERHPTEFYERLGLGADATPADARYADTANGTKGYPARREPWEGYAAVLRFAKDELLEFRLLPLDLGFGEPLPARGRPRLADAALGEHLRGYLADQSRAYGTKVRRIDERATAIDLGR
jgi:poly-gamma-glutamate synthesis protein (capsule biosynthesis protein)